MFTTTKLTILMLIGLLCSLMVSMVHALPVPRPTLEPRFFLSGAAGALASYASMYHYHTSAAGRVDLDLGVTSVLLVGGVAVGVMGGLW